jgi:hypothetical protein
LFPRVPQAPAMGRETDSCMVSAIGEWSFDAARRPGKGHARHGPVTIASSGSGPSPPPPLLYSGGGGMVVAG